MRRLTAKMVFCGFVTAWRFADWPTRTSLSFVNATIDGVVRSPSLFSMTRGLPPSMIATQEFVVPRSMPMILPISNLRNNLFGEPWPLSGGPSHEFQEIFSSVRSASAPTRRRAPAEEAFRSAGSRAGRPSSTVFGAALARLRHHRFVQFRIERRRSGLISSICAFSKALASRRSVAFCPSTRLAHRCRVGARHSQRRARANPSPRSGPARTSRPRTDACSRDPWRPACARFPRRPARAGTAPSDSSRAPRKPRAPAGGAPFRPARPPSRAAPCVLSSGPPICVSEFGSVIKRPLIKISRIGAMNAPTGRSQSLRGFVDPTFGNFKAGTGKNCRAVSGVRAPRPRIFAVTSTMGMTRS